MPIERVVVIPFAFLSKFAPHEQELLAGMAVHEGIIGAQIRKTLPIVAGHAAEDRTFAVDDFVVRERQDEIFGERVMQTEQNVTVMVFAMDWVLTDILQRVVHPTHVPFVTEAEAAMFDGMRHLRPCRRFLGGGRGVRKAAKHFGVEAAKESDGIEIFPAAKAVGYPFAR